MFRIIDGSSVAKDIRASIRQEILSLGKKRKPHLAVILVGDDGPSKIYVQNKGKACEDVGIHSETIHKPGDTSEADLLTLIDRLNEDPGVDGILVQLPLPKHMDTFKVTSRINPNKDVDGLTPINQGLLVMNKAIHVPCTPKGIIKLLESIEFPFEGALAAVIGRSQLVGAPVAKLLTHKNATVINIHSRTKEAWKLTRQADLVIAAIGKAKMIDESWIKEGAVVIDVGIHRIEGKMCGDVDFDSAKSKASWMTPVPGGVGPMTIACLLVNCLDAYKRSFFEYPSAVDVP